jgi:hypothetical protein
MIGTSPQPVEVRVWEYGVCGLCGRDLKKGPLKSDVWLHVATSQNDCPLGTVALPGGRSSMGSEIQRYSTFNGGLPNPLGDDGKWVLYADHQRIVEALEAALEKIADHHTQLPWRACAQIARGALNGE